MAKPDAARWMMRIFRNLLLQAVLLVATFIACEAAYRAYLGVPVFGLKNLIDEELTLVGDAGPAVYDAELGWRLRADYRSPPNVALRLTTGKFGIRMNMSDEIRPLQKGAILAVGDSFTAGSEVADDGSWPAALERLLGQQVNNAAAGGWGVDQIVKRATLLMDSLAPRTIIYSFLDQDILRNAYDIFGAYKPYFDVRAGRLVEKGVPVPDRVTPVDRVGWLRWIFGRSYIVHDVMRNTAPLWWLSRDIRFRKVHDYRTAVKISCLLLKQIKMQSQQNSFRPLLILQYGSTWIAAKDKPSWYAQNVLDCAKELDFETLDTFTPIKAIARSDANKFHSFYVLRGKGSKARLGHMSKIGNEYIAKLIKDKFFATSTTAR